MKKLHLMTWLIVANALALYIHSYLGGHAWVYVLCGMVIGRIAAEAERMFVWEMNHRDKK